MDRPSLDQLMQLIEGVKSKQGQLQKVTEQPSQGQRWGNPGQNRGDMFMGRGDPAQKRAMMQMASSILNRQPGQNSVGALADGFNKGSQVMDDIRAKQKAESVGSATTALKGAQDEYGMGEDLYGKQYKAYRDSVGDKQTSADLAYKNRALEERSKERDQKISVETEKTYKGFWEAKNENQANAAKYGKLADEFAKADYSGGVPTRINEFMKELVGSEDATTALLKEGRAVTVTSAIQNLPPGVASDKDIELVMAPQPSQFANPKYLEQYLRARAKVEKLNAEYNQFALSYMDQNTTKGNKMIGLDTAWRVHKIPYGAKQMLRDNPSMKAAFDKKYGRGMAERVLK